MRRHLQEVDDEKSRLDLQNQRDELTTQMDPGMNLVESVPVVAPKANAKAPSVWKLVKAEDNPQFNNSCDSGIACMIYADVGSNDLPALFTNDDVHHFRKKVCFSFLSGDVVA